MPEAAPDHEPRAARGHPNQRSSIAYVIITAALMINTAAITWFITQQTQHTTPITTQRHLQPPTRTPAPAPAAASVAQPASSNPTLATLNTLPATSNDPNLPTVHAFLDFECPFCQQLVETPAWNNTLELASAGRINLSVNPVAFLTPNSQTKANAFNCSNPHQHPDDLADVIAALKTPGVMPPPDLPLRWVSEAERDACAAREDDLRLAMLSAQQLGVSSVPTVFIDGVTVPWPELGQHLNAALERLP